MSLKLRHNFLGGRTSCNEDWLEQSKSSRKAFFNFWLALCYHQQGQRDGKVKVDEQIWSNKKLKGPTQTGLEGRCFWNKYKKEALMMRSCKQIWKMLNQEVRNVLHRKSLWKSCVKRDKKYFVNPSPNFTCYQGYSIIFYKLLLPFKDKCH